MSAASPWRSLAAPAVASLIALAILLGLGTWQLQRGAWKQEIVAQIQARAYGDPVPVAGERDFQRLAGEEYRRVRLAGVFLHDREAHVHGLMAAQRGQPVQGFYVLTPLRLADGSHVIVNRGFVPTELRDPERRAAGQIAGEVEVVGLVRAPEARGWFVPADEPARNRWFTRDPLAVAKAQGLARPAPFLVDADATPNPGGWPRGGQTRLDIPDNHLQYALTWFGLALTLVGVFAAFVWRRLHPGEGDHLAPDRP
ncbi:MAG TPA: SURF1 family protein [Beijerinckiaceae bacterium]|nr:SURF1 family protein [Beijerinckiaceae bacterium]